MVPVVDKHGKLVKNKHGQPLLARCPFVFISSARRKGNLETSAVQSTDQSSGPPDSATNGAQRSQEHQASSDQSTDDMLLTHNELAKKFTELLTTVC